MENFRVAVKSFIVKDNKLLLIKRRKDDIHKPEDWDIPGGRLGIGENPLEGLKRETKEEINIDIKILLPFHVQHFVRDDGQKITMIIFLCRPLGGGIKLSKEHTDYKWFDVSQKNSFPKWLKPVIDAFIKYKLNNAVA